MNKKLMFVMIVALLLATPAFAQTQGSAPAPLLGSWSLSAIGLGLAVAGAGFGQGKVAAAACEGIARNPGAQAKIQLAMIFGLAFIESLVLFVWVMLFLAGIKIIQ